MIRAWVKSFLVGVLFCGVIIGSGDVGLAENHAPLLRVVVKDGLVTMEARNVDVSAIVDAVPGLVEYCPDTSEYRVERLSISSKTVLQVASLVCRTSGHGKIEPESKDIVFSSRGKTNDIVLYHADGGPRRVALSSVVTRPVYRPHQLLVRWKEKVSARQRQKVHAELGSRSLHYLSSMNLEKVLLPEGASVNAMQKKFSEIAFVDHAGQNYLRYGMGTVPDDTGYSQQWGMRAIDAERAWQFATGKRETLIGVIDTGINYNHADLAANMWVNTVERDGVADFDDDNNGLIDDVYGYDFGDDDPDPAPAVNDNHGTEVAGILGAVGNNSQGLAGVSWQVSLVNSKVIDQYGGIDVYAIVRALDYYIQRGDVHIVTCSFGGPNSDDNERLAFERLLQKGILAVCAAGNYGHNEDITLETQRTYPAAYNFSNMLSVTAVDSKGDLGSFANYGAQSVQLAAPGVLVPVLKADGSIGKDSGTSHAVPYVAATAAMLLDIRPELTSVMLRDALIHSATMTTAL